MSRPLEPVVPTALRRELDGASLEEGFTILVLTGGGDWPHVAMVSRGELVCAGPSALMLALWPASTACANLSGRRRGTLSAVADGVAYSLRIAARRLEDIETPLGGRLACFRGEIDSVSADEAPYAVLESGVRFRLLNPEATLARWRQVRVLLQARGGSG